MSWIKNRLPNDCDITNKTCNGNCSCCGSCCTEFLPVTRKEVENIFKYLRTHDIKEQYPYKEGKDLYVSCPFCSEETHKCLIYEVRPKVCRRFICSLSSEEITKNRTIDSCERAYFNRCDAETGAVKRMISFHSMFFGDANYDVCWRHLTILLTLGEGKVPFEKEKELIPMLVDTIDKDGHIKF